MIRRKQHIIQLIRQKVNEIDNTAEVILYGSRARGDNKRDSDWDVMILLKRKTVINDLKTLAWVYNISECRYL